MLLRRPPAALATAALARSTLASSPAGAERITGWNLSECFASGCPTIDGATSVDTLSGNPSDFVPTVDAGAQAKAVGAICLDEAVASMDVHDCGGSEQSIFFTGALPGNADAPAVNPFASFTTQAAEGQLFTSSLGQEASSASSAASEPDPGSVSKTRCNGSLGVAARTPAGSSSVGTWFSTDGSSQQSLDSATLLPSDAAYNVTLGTAASEQAYVRFNFAPANATDLPIIDNVASVVPEASASSSALVALAVLVLSRRRVSDPQNPPALSRG